MSLSFKLKNKSSFFETIAKISAFHETLRFFFNSWIQHHRDYVSLPLENHSFRKTEERVLKTFNFAFTIVSIYICTLLRKQFNGGGVTVLALGYSYFGMMDKSFPHANRRVLAYSTDYFEVFALLCGGSKNM